MAKEETKQELVYPEPTPNKRPKYLDKIGHALDVKILAENTKTRCEVGETHGLIVNGKLTYYTVEEPTGAKTFPIDVYRGKVCKDEEDYRKHVAEVRKDPEAVPCRRANWRATTETRTHWNYGAPVEYTLQGGLEFAPAD